MLTKSDFKILVLILCWIALLITLNCLTLNGAFDGPYEPGYRCVYIIEDLDGNIHEAETCGDRTCRVGNIHYAYKWRRLECEE